MLTTPYTNVVSCELCVISRVQNGLGFAILIYENGGIEMPNFLLVLCFATWFGAATSASSNHVSLKQQPSQDERSKRHSHKAESIVYVDKKFGFRFSLPASWKGYSIVADKWGGGDGGSY